MEIDQFIEENRQELIRCIQNAVPNCRIDDDEIERWIANDEGLYLWAIDMGVEV